MRKLVLLLVLACGVSSQNSHAACGLSLAPNNVSLTWSLATNYVAVQFTVNKALAPSCNYSVTFTDGGAGGYGSRHATSGANTLAYQLYGNAGLTDILKDIPDITVATDVIQGSFDVGPNQSTVFTYYLQIPSGPATTPTLVKAGTYTNTYNLKIFEKVGLPVGGDTPADTQSATLTVTVNSMMGLSVVNTGGFFDSISTSRSLDFGVLRPNKSISCDIRIRTNTAYQITMKSANAAPYAGKFVTKDGGGTVRGSVPYSVSVDGSSFTLNSETQVATGSGSTGLEGVAIPVIVTIGDFDLATTRAGPYTDTITVEIKSP